MWTIKLFSRCCDICKYLRLEITAIYSRYQRFGVDDFISKSSKIWPSYFDAEYRLPLLHHIGDLKDLQLQPSLQMGLAASILIR
jgi:hypothetical protein